MAGVTSEVKKIHDATRQQNQVARTASSSAAAATPRPGTPTGAPATAPGAKGPPTKLSKATVEDTDDEDDAGAKSTNEDDEDIFAYVGTGSGLWKNHARAAGTRSLTGFHLATRMRVALPPSTPRRRTFRWWTTPK